MEKIKSNEETFDISKLPHSFIEYGKSIEREETSLRIAVNLLAENLPIDLIVRTTGLPKEQVFELKKNWNAGKKEGEVEIKERIAQNLIAGNIPIDIIIRTTDLSKEKIIDLKKALDEDQKVGFEEGREVGREITRELISFKLLKEHIPDNLIGNFTGIDQKDLEQLKNKL